MSADRAKSSDAALRRSAIPNLPGVPWWAAALIAIIATAVGFGFDAGFGGKELTGVFAVMYAIGCLIAVLAVRQAGIFTAVVQPPLILFVAVPGAYYLFTHSEIAGIKDIAINCGYPLIERFLLMFSTSVVVLLIGMARWYFGGARGVPPKTRRPKSAAEPGAMSSMAAKFSGLFGGGAAVSEEDELAEPARKHAIDRPATAARPARTRRPSKRPAPTRSRHARPPVDGLAGPDKPSAADRPDRPRRRPAYPRDFDAAGPPEPREPVAEPRRRPRVPRDPDARGVPRERHARPRRPEPAEHYDQFEPPTYEPSQYEPGQYDPPPRRRPAPSSSSGTHHPVSKVRYRGNAEDGDNQVQHRTRPRPPRHAAAETWGYDD